MQNFSRKGSILLAVLFFSGVIFVVFASFSSVISETLKGMWQSELSSETSDVFHSLSVSGVSEASSNRTIISLQKEGNVATVLVLSGTTLEGKFTKAGTLTLALLEGAPVRLNSSSIVGYSFSGTPFSFSNPASGVFSLTVLGGYSRVQISGNFLLQNENYRISHAYGSDTVLSNTLQITR